MSPSPVGCPRSRWRVASFAGEVVMGWGFVAGLACAVAMGALGDARRALGQEVSGLQAALALEQAVVDAIAKAEISVVSIARVRKDQDRFSAEGDEKYLSPDFVPNEYGAGVVIDRDGLILTTHHVVGDPRENKYFVWTQGKPHVVKETHTLAERFSAAVVAADPWMDLAVLRIESSSLTPITLGDAGAVKKGQFVLALGNPRGAARDGRPSASWGIVSNLSRATERPHPEQRLGGGRDTVHQYGGLIQTDAKLELGASGGPLLNLRGEMIGLATTYAAQLGLEKAGGYAIPVDDAFKKAIETLRQGRKAEFGFLGVAPKNLDGAALRAGRSGAWIENVVPGTPASAARLQPDDVITHVNGQAIEHANALMGALGRLPADELVTLAIDRRGRAITRVARLGKKYFDPARTGYSQQPEPTWRGLRVDHATAVPPDVLKERLFAIDPGGCVVIAEVTPDTPAWKAGLRPWTFVSHVDDKPVANPAQFYGAVAAAKGLVRLRLTSLEGGTTPIRAVAP